AFFSRFRLRRVDIDRHGRIFKRVSQLSRSFALGSLESLLVLAGKVIGQAGTSGNEATDNDVLFQTTQIVALAHDGGFGQNTRGFLERGSRNERVGRQRSFGDTQQHVVIRRRATVLGSNTVVFVQQF